MKPDRSRLIFLALTILDKAVDDAAHGPLTGSPAIRLALAILFHFSGGQDRAAFDEFWTTIRDPLERQFSDTQRNYIRQSYARTMMTKIARDVGLELTVALSHKISAARRNGRPHEVVKP